MSFNNSSTKAFWDSPATHDAIDNAHKPAAVSPLARPAQTTAEKVFSSAKAPLKFVAKRFAAKEKETKSVSGGGVGGGGQRRGGVTAPRRPGGSGFKVRNDKGEWV
jgi:hypothetical protein